MAENILAKQSDFTNTIRAFLETEDDEKAFSLLDQLCTAITSMPELVANIHDALSLEQVRAKTLAIDAAEEEQNARAVIRGQQSSDDYSWALADYYDSEVTFITNRLGHNVTTIAHIGPGPVPSLALAFQRHNPDIAIDCFDCDAVATMLGQQFVRQVGNTDNVRFFNSDLCEIGRETRYDIACVSNAAIPDFAQRATSLPAEQVFVRSATQAGAMLYPRLPVVSELAGTYREVCRVADPLYNIHEMVMLTPK